MDRRHILACSLAASLVGVTEQAGAQNFMIIDDLSQPVPRAANGADWEYVADRVMGGVSTGGMTREKVGGREAVRMRGDVSLDNNGGFIQIALDLSASGESIDASAWRGIALDILGNGEEYNLHLRTDDMRRHWQSYRQNFRAGSSWQTLLLPFNAFTAYRIEVPLDLKKLRRIGVVAIGRVFNADISVGGVRLYK
ncbi:MAG: CIA30 family protein [Pseudomonadota bacterium]